MDNSRNGQLDFLASIERMRKVHSDVVADVEQLEQHVREVYDALGTRLDQLEQRVSMLEESQHDIPTSKVGASRSHATWMRNMRGLPVRSTTGLRRAAHDRTRLALYGLIVLAVCAGVIWLLWRSVAPREYIAFNDGFESKNPSRWSSIRFAAGGAVTVQHSIVEKGKYAIRLSALSRRGSYAYARTYLSSPQQNVTVSGDFRVLSEGPKGGNVTLVRLYNATGDRLVSIFRQNRWGTLWVQQSNAYHITRAKLPLDTWAHLDLHVVTIGSRASTVELRLYGVLVYETTIASLGRSGVLAVQIGNEVQRQPFTLVVDNFKIAVQPMSLF